MKIAFVTGCFPKLSETFVLDQITGLVELGHDVRIFSFEPATETLRHAAVERYGLLARAMLLDEPTDGLLAGAVSALPAIGSWVGGLRYKKALATRFARGSQGAFDVIYCHFGHVAERARRLRRAGFFSGPLVAVFHAYDLAVVPRQQGRTFYRELFAEAERLLPITERWRKELVALGADPTKVDVRRMGVELDAFTFRERTLAAGEALGLVSVGRLVEKKGFAVAIEALVRVRDKLPARVAYHVVGDGPLRQELARVAAERGVADVVTFHGAKDHAEVARVLDSMHVLLAPSVTAADGDMEGLPMVVMEAMARGLPVVATDHSGVPELVRHGVTGLLVPERDPEALGAAILELARHPERWPELARAGRLAVETGHDARRLTRELAEFFEGLARK